jgi:peroxiredoxin
MSGTLLGVMAATLVAGAGVSWLRRMQAVRLPRNAAPYLVACALAAGLGVAAFVVGTGRGRGPRGRAGDRRRVGVPGPVLGERSTARAAGGRGGRTDPRLCRLGRHRRPFALASLRGRPFLLKFFRGHWCPYCVAELRRWEELRSELDARDVAVVTVCADAAEVIRRGRGKHGLRAVMIADPELAITDQYHLRNPHNFALKSGVIVPLPIPTTILVDAAGTVRWIDQATDYMRRSDPERVLAAIRMLDADAPPRRAAAL